MEGTRTIKIKSMGIEFYGYPLRSSQKYYDRTEFELEKIGKGWRIPTTEELFFIKSLNDLGITQFPEDISYWSSSPSQEGVHFDTIFDFAGDGEAYSAYYTNVAAVIPIRNI